MGQSYGLSQKFPDFSKIMSGILHPKIPTFWNSVRTEAGQFIIIKTTSNR